MNYVVQPCFIKTPSLKKNELLLKTIFLLRRLRLQQNSKSLVLYRLRQFQIPNKDGASKHSLSWKFKQIFKRLMIMLVYLEDQFYLLRSSLSILIFLEWGRISWESATSMQSCWGITLRLSIFLWLSPHVVDESIRFFPRRSIAPLNAVAITSFNKTYLLLYYEVQW